MTIKLSRENVGMKSDEKKEKKQKLNDKTEKEFREYRFWTLEILAIVILSSFLKKQTYLNKIDKFELSSKKYTCWSKTCMRSNLLQLSIHNQICTTSDCWYCCFCQTTFSSKAFEKTWASFSKFVKCLTLLQERRSH